MGYPSSGFAHAKQVLPIPSPWMHLSKKLQKDLQTGPSHLVCLLKFSPCSFSRWLVLTEVGGHFRGILGTCLQGPDSGLQSEIVRQSIYCQWLILTGNLLCLSDFRSSGRTFQRRWWNIGDMGRPEKTTEESRHSSLSLTPRDAFFAWT